MDIKAEKIELIGLLLNTENFSILSKIKKIFELEKEDDFCNNLTDVQIASIERGLSQIEQGKVISHKEVRKIYEKWL
ncbi:MAG: hypothetical protein FVQ77_02860 [Cytophagales bacterium]|nr:hypothetical protein [Cytophagales bacterium]